MSEGRMSRAISTSADSATLPLFAENPSQGVEDLGGPAERFPKRGGAQRSDHELLDVESVGRVRPAVQDVHERHGQESREGAPQVAVEGQAQLLRRGTRVRQRHAEDGVRAELRLVRGPVQVAERLVESDLVEGFAAADRGRDHLVHVPDRPQHPFPSIPLGVPVAELECLVSARRRAAGNGRPTGAAGPEEDLHLDGGIAPRVEDFTALDMNDRCHDAHGIAARLRPHRLRAPRR